MKSSPETLLKACKKKSKLSTEELVKLIDEYDVEMKNLYTQLMTLQTMVSTITIELYMRGREMKDD